MKNEDEYLQELLNAFSTMIIKAYKSKTKEEREKYFYHAYGNVILIKVLIDHRKKV